MITDRLKQLDETEIELKRLQKAITVYRKVVKEHLASDYGKKYPHTVPSSKEYATIKRASMDVTRNLAQMRKP